MVKARFHKVAVSNGDEIELSESISALTIHAESGLKCIVTWLEEVKE